jgi:hypothetical protein
MSQGKIQILGQACIARSIANRLPITGDGPTTLSGPHEGIPLVVKHGAGYQASIQNLLILRRHS